MRRVLVLALLALALPMAAWADIVTTNQFGTVSITGMAGTGGLGTLGVSTISSKGSQLTQWNSTKGSLGTVNFATGALSSGSISGGGMFAGGGSFDITGVGHWASLLTGGKCGTGCSLFAGSFTGPISWTLLSSNGQESSFALTGTISGMMYNGRDVTGTTTQYINIFSRGQLNQGIGHVNMGGGNLSTPEPGTLGLLGTGLVSLAGMFRRKLIGA
jgi:PEP-CTERM motif